MEDVNSEPNLENVDYWTHDRVVKDVPLLRKKEIDIDEIYSDNGLPNVDVVREGLSQEGRFSYAAIERVVNDVKEIFSSEPNMITIDSNVRICGDVHGQFYDLMKLLEIGGDPKDHTYLFLGDYVDRGSFSTECLLLLYCIKIRYPTTFFMLRGNHECRHLTEYFTFKNECNIKYSSEIYEIFCDSFNTLPLAAHVNKQFLCLHGGLSPEIIHLKDINSINRFREPPNTGPFCDILWADPHESYGSEESSFHYTFNNTRGCSFYFSFSACCEFLTRNNLLSVIRAHEVQDAGYKMYRKSQNSAFPSLITVFSAPNYLDVYNNKAAILIYEKSVLNIRQFNCSPHPYWLPNFMDVFTWSLPFVGEKVTEMLGNILNVCSSDELETKTDEIISTSPRREVIKNKILAVGRMSKVFSVLREEQLSVIKLKGLTPSGFLPSGILAGGKDSLLSALNHLTQEGQLVTNFDQARQLDIMNERMPPNKGELNSQNENTQPSTI